MNPVTLAEAVSEPGFLVALALGAATGAGALIHRRGAAWLLSTAAALVIALLLAGEPRNLGWPSLPLIAVAALAAVASSVGASLITRAHGTEVAFACLIITALGVWGTVPDTENAIVLLGVVSGAFVGAGRVRAPISAWPWLPVVALAVSLGITDGQARASATVGAVAVFGVLLVGPVVSRMAGVVSSWRLLGVHVVLVVLGGRVAGTADTVLTAAVFAVIGLLLGVGLLVGLAHWPGRAGQKPTT